MDSSMGPPTILAEATAVPINQHQNNDVVISQTPCLHRYEIITGLWAQLSGNATVTKKDLGDGRYSLTVRSAGATLGDYLFIAENFCLCGVLNYFSDGLLKVNDLNISMDRLLVDPLSNRAEVAAFIDLFGCGQPKSSSGQQSQSQADDSVYHNNNDSISIDHQRSLPTRRLAQDEWEQFLQNVRNDVRLSSRPCDSGTVMNQYESDNNKSELPSYSPPQENEAALCATIVDVIIPHVKVCAVRCKVSNEKGEPTEIAFPGCAGSSNCTLRSLLQYYSESVLDEMDMRSGNKARIDVHTTTSDITGVGGSIVGAAAGGAMLGPAGCIAGSVVGSDFGKKNSASIAGAAAGAILFGPIGLVAGACYGASSSRGVKSREVGSTNNSFSTAPTARMEASTKSTPQSVRRAASEHIQSNKYEYGGSAGVVAGATAGAATLGPVGLVAGAYLGSVSGRKIVESASMNADRAKRERGEDEKHYRFGDITRGVISRGKESRGASRNEGYQFGDFTRGLFSRGTGN